MIDENSKISDQPKGVWRTRSALAILTLIVVILGISLFDPRLFGSGLTLWLFISFIWGLGIFMTWAGARFQKKTGKKLSPSSLRTDTDNDGQLP